MPTTDILASKFIGVPGSRDMGDKFLLIGLTVQLYKYFLSKKPKVTIYQTIKACVGSGIEVGVAELAQVCEAFMYGCDKFPDFGIPIKDIPAKIKELWLNSVPF